jgi:hypothetical protein
MRTLTLLVALALVPAGPAVAAQGRGHEKKVEKAAKPDKADKNAGKHKGAVPPDVVVVDRDGHARVIREYAHAGSRPPGLAQREALPPGLARQLHENGELPPGLEKRWVAVPQPWIGRLPPVPSYYRRYFAGDDLIVVDSRTNRIAAIIRDVLN